MKNLIAFTSVNGQWYYFYPTDDRSHLPRIESATVIDVTITLGRYNVGPVTVHDVSNDGASVISLVTFEQEPEKLVKDATLRPINCATGSRVRNAFSSHLERFTSIIRDLKDNPVHATMGELTAADLAAAIAAGVTLSPTGKVLDHPI